MDYTSRMAALLGRFRRERNGVVADTMQYRGKAYGLNYGVSLPTIRAVARAERPDSDFARFLYRQDVRELKLAAFWIADPVQVTSVEFSDWGEGIANSEMAEECAFALMSRSPRGDEWGRAWCDTGNELLGYAGLLALSRIPHPDFSSLVPVLRRLVVTYPESNLVAQGVVALLAAIMTLGNLGENYELLAMKSAGMSLPKILKPLIIVVGIIAIGSFFVVNNLVPYANKKMLSILYDIRQQKQVIEFQDGLFFNGIEDMSIRVGKQDPKTHLLRDVLIYDNRNINGNMTTTVADSGYIRLSDDKKYLLVTLFNGETYEQTRNYQWYSKSALRHHIFEKQDGVIPMEGFGFERSDANFSNQSTTKNIAQLDRAIDSLELTVNSATTRSYEPLLREQIFANDNQVLPLPDSARIDKSGFRDALIADSIARLGLRDRDKVWGIARANAKNSRGLFSFDESTAKEALNQLYRSKIEWHRKISLPISIMIFFLIGAPLGAIIRKGGLGTPIVISVIFFVIYYIISISGEKAAREGNWEAFYGMWLSSFILAPIAVYLTYKATNDSVLLDVDWYTGRIKYYKEKWGIHTPKWMSALAGRFKRKPEENK